MTEMKDDAFHDAHREQRLTLCTSGLFPDHHYILKKLNTKENITLHKELLFLWNKI